MEIRPKERILSGFQKSRSYFFLRHGLLEKALAWESGTQLMLDSFTYCVIYNLHFPCCKMCIKIPTSQCYEG